MKSKESLIIGGTKIGPGETRDVDLKVSETYAGTNVHLLVRVIRAKKPGPVLFLTGVVHGDELNGMGIIREIMLKELNLLNGTLICVPVVNIFGFESHSRYLPDRRDLNRSFPGNASGSLAMRLAHTVFTEIISHCDYGIDMHTAARFKTNFPHIRTDLSVPKLREAAFAFGCELVIDKPGHEAMLRHAATKSGVKTLLFEGGEVLKFEPSIMALGMRGVMNIMKHLDMIEGKPIRPPYQTAVKKTTWLRSDAGGTLRFHIHPGEVVEKGQVIATSQKLFSADVHEITSTLDGVVLGMTTLPAVKPGEPICHLALPEIPIAEIKKKVEGATKGLHKRARQELATNIKVEGKRE